MELKADLDAALAPIKNEVGKIEGLPNTRTMIFTVFGAATSLFLGGLAVLAYGGDRFGDGASSVGALAQQKVEERQRQEQIIQQQHDSEARLRCLIEKQQAPKLVCDDKP